MWPTGQFRILGYLKVTHKQYGDTIMRLKKWEDAKLIFALSIKFYFTIFNEKSCIWEITRKIYDKFALQLKMVCKQNFVDRFLSFLLPSYWDIDTNLQTMKEWKYETHISHINGAKRNFSIEKTNESDFNTLNNIVHFDTIVYAKSRPKKWAER